MTLSPGNDEKKPEGHARESEAEAEEKKPFFWLYIMAAIGALLGGADAHRHLSEEASHGINMEIILAGAEAVGGALVGGIIGWLIDAYREKRARRGRP
jgi:hypothetical protein